MQQHWNIFECVYMDDFRLPVWCGLYYKQPSVDSNRPIQKCVEPVLLDRLSDIPRG